MQAGFWMHTSNNDKPDQDKAKIKSLLSCELKGRLDTRPGT